MGTTPWAFVAKGLLPYHGLGSGIKRALEGWPDIDFADDREGCLFTATVHRKEQFSSLKSAGKTPRESSPESSLKSSPKTEDKIIDFLRQDGSITTEELGKAIGISKRAVLKQIDKLKGQGRLRRIDPAKGGHWEVVERR
ncbi:MAG: HTH domain-containing protein [Deltaproteobacteria bacterium]|nr:HTH domain-containing protein [Deltaproteobacteria bacterium]